MRRAARRSGPVRYDTMAPVMTELRDRQDLACGVGSLRDQRERRQPDTDRRRIAAS